MKEIVKIPYGKNGFLNLEIPEENLIGVFTSKKGDPILDEKQAIQRALSNPIDVPPLIELAKKKKSAVIAITDASRPNIEKKVLSLVIEHLESGGLAKKDIKIIIGPGSHRAAYQNEIDEMLGELKDQVEVVCHNAFESEMKCFGKTSFGYPIEVNCLFAESDLKIIVGTVLPHPFAGFSGGGKMISVGIASAAAISSTHTPDMLDHPNTGWGLIKDNPFYLSSIEQAKIIRVDFLINAVMDEDENLLYVSTGEVQKAHLACINKTKELFEVDIPEAAEIVVVSSGYPKDSNLYHVSAMAICAVAGSAVKYPCIKKDGTIIAASPMEEGAYNQVFYNTLQEAETPAEVIKKVRSITDLEPGHHRAYGVAQVLDKYKVIMAQSKLDSNIISSIHIEPNPSLQNAFEKTLAHYGNKAKVIVLLDTHRMIAKCRQ